MDIFKIMKLEIRVSKRKSHNKKTGRVLKLDLPVNH